MSARILRADPSRVRVRVRRVGLLWLAIVGCHVSADRCPRRAVETALARAACARVPGIDLDGAVWPDPSGPRARVEP